MRITADLTGLADFQKRLEAIGKDAATKAGQSANRAGAVVLAKQVRKEAPNSPKTTEGEIRTRHNRDKSTRKEVHGKIVNHVRVKKTKSLNATTVQNSVVIGQAYHANFVMFGSIRNAADPFMLDALETAQQPIIDTIAKVLEKRLTKLGV